MAETIVQEQVTTQAQEEVKPDLVAEAKAQAAKELAGLNRKISEMEKILKQAELAKLDDVSRAKAEADNAKAERDALIKETQKLRIDMHKEKSLIKVGIPTDFMKYLNGDTEEDVDTNIKGLKEFLDKELDSRMKTATAKLLSGDVPNAVTTPGAKTMKRDAFFTLDAKAQGEYVKAGGKIVD